jgi:hypothetical protein
MRKLDYKNLLIGDLCDYGKITKNEAIKILEDISFDKLINEMPEYIMHIDTTDYAEEILEQIKKGKIINYKR